jgi:hypothetical protein
MLPTFFRLLLQESYALDTPVSSKTLSLLGLSKITCAEHVSRMGDIRNI